MVFLGIDLYVLQGIPALMHVFKLSDKRLVYFVYAFFSILLFSGILLLVFMGDNLSKTVRTFFLVFISLNFVPKLVFSIFLLIDDLQRGFRWIGGKVYHLFGPEVSHLPGVPISRSEFLLKTGIVAATIPLVSISYGVFKGAYDYRIKRVKLPLPNLPAAFEGLKIGQISDIHTGSFYNKTAVKGGVEMLLAEKPDIIFFTGDLVNQKAVEVKDYIDLFGKVKAPLGVYSTLGNHDYGDYVQWPSKEAKRANLENLMQVHKIMGWDLLMNENRIIQQGADKLAIIGVENWGAGARWPKYGRLDEAVIGTEDIPIKLLLSHDPSHWDAQVRPEFKDIDVMFAGHTHGFQFGVELGPIKWSPAQYFYKQWAGLYKQDGQMLYVNRGYGFLGFPGRVGMPPEITIFELHKT